MLLIITGQFPPATGGVPQSLGALCQRFDSARIAVLTGGRVDAGAGDASTPYRVFRYPSAVDDDLSTYSLPRFGAGLFRVSAFALKVAAQIRPQLTFCYTSRLPDLACAYLLGLARGIPYVAYCHGEDVPLPGKLLKRDRLRLPLLRKARCVLTNSRPSRRRLEGLDLEGLSMQVIAPGVDTERFSPGEADAARGKLGISQHIPVLLTVGRLDRRKGHDLVLKALPVLLQDFPGLRYLIVGTGPESSRLRALAATKGVMEHVCFRGFQADKVLPDYYRACDVFVMPNRELPDGDTEGLGLVFLEASACARPVIGGRVGGALDAVQHGKTGYLVEPDDVADLASVVGKLLRNPDLRRRLGREGRARTVSRFAVPRQARKLWSQFESVVGRPIAPLSSSVHKGRQTAI